ncbi:TPA: nucleotidyltransferase domain-containing protein [Candidatus Bathyarchaeota archaeon]|nr:nucleotidyltransferase domain-containing protein [Candidatus Bathyarchaeota archaeon]
MEYDPNVVEIIQFGSSIYAPWRARDVDLLVITKEVKDYGGYLDAANLEDAPFNVDVLVLKVGEPQARHDSEPNAVVQSDDHAFTKLREYSGQPKLLTNVAHSFAPLKPPNS